MMEVAEVSRTKFDPYVIGDNIRDLREKRKMTQMKAAEEMDMSLCHYARIEEGSKGMSIQMLFRFINFYKTDANTILGTHLGGWCKMDKKDLKDEKLLYNVRETAAVLGVNVHLVYELINRKLLPAFRLGSLKVRKSTLIDFVERYEGMDLSDLDNIKELQQNMN